MMTAPFSIFPLLKTKLLVPEVRPGFVKRPRLTAMLDEGMLHPLTLVSAPAGFGKTTLLAEWAAQGTKPLAWLTLDPADNDVLRFFTYLIAALRTMHPQVGEETMSFIHNNRPETLEAGLTLLINELSTVQEEFVLILDEFHSIEEPAILWVMNFLLENHPPALNMIIAARSDPPFAINRLRVKGSLVEIRTEDLRFTKGEAAEFLKTTMRLQITDRELDILEEQTEGWITGLQLAALSLRNQPDMVGFLTRTTEGSQFVAEFLLEEVLHQQLPEVQRFLLWTSILDTLHGSICDAVMQTEESRSSSEILERLDRANLFVIALDKERQWFRYHPIFAEFLQQQLNEVQGEEIPKLHRRASTWYSAHDNQDAAIVHALAAGDNERAAELIECHFNQLVQTGGVITLAGWIRKLPLEVINARPRLCLAVAWGYLFSLDLDLADEWAEAARAQAEKQIAEQEQAGGDLHAAGELLGQVAAYQALIATIRGNSQLTLKYLHEALALLPEDDLFWRSFVVFNEGVLHTMSGRMSQAVEKLKEATSIAKRSGNLFLLVMATCHLGELLVHQGQLNRGLATYQQMIPITKDPHGAPLPLAGIVLIGQGEILRERNQVAESLSLLEQGIRLSRAWAPSSALDGYISLARLRHGLGDGPGARQSLEEAMQLAESTGASDWDDILVAVHMTRLLLQQGDLPAAVRCARRHGLIDDRYQANVGGFPAVFSGPMDLLQARLWLALGLQAESKVKSPHVFLDQVVEHLHAVCHQLAENQQHGTRIEAMVLLALAEQHRGNVSEAYAALGRAFPLAEPEGYVRIFADEGAPMHSLLTGFRAQRRWSGDLRWQAYLDHLIAALDTAGATPDETPLVDSGQRAPPASAAEPHPDLVEPLTPRELDVLRLIADGLSNQEIAAALCIEVNTVKRHASNIYGKLGVKKRGQAMLRARHLGLLL